MHEQEKLNRLDAAIQANKGQKGAVMVTLQEAQEIFGYVPKDIQIRIAEGLGVTLSEVYGVATFYAQFALQPRGEHVIGVCLGTACYVKGSKNILDKLIEEALVQAPSMTIAEARFKQAVAIAKQVGAVLQPQVSMDASATVQKLSYNYNLPPDLTPRGTHGYGSMALNFN